MNNSEREQWVNNNEYLYNLKRHSRLSMANFLKQYRQEIDEQINAEMNIKPESD